jgi:hypothetical protein
MQSGYITTDVVSSISDYDEVTILTSFTFWFSCYVRVPVNNFTIVSPIHFIFKLSEKIVSLYPYGYGVPHFQQYLGRDRMPVGSTTSYTISVYHH